MKEMTVWFDVNTPKHALLFSVISSKLEKKNFKTIITARDYDATLGVLERLGRKYLLVGRYGGRSLSGKLKSSLEKSLNIVSKFEDLDIYPDLAIHFSSPEAARVSFGLGIPSICLSDTPHSYFTIKLAVSLSNYLVLTEAVPKSYFTDSIDSERIISYRGVDPLEWVFDIKPEKSILRNIGLERGEKFIVFRPEETFASYYLNYSQGKPLTIGSSLLEFLVKNFPDHKIIFLTRYPEQSAVIRKEYGEQVILPNTVVLGVDLLHNADLLITGGETMALESSLLGTPAITYFPKILHPTFYLKSKGFPIEHEVRLEKIRKIIHEVLKDPDEYRVDTKSIVKEMEKPSDAVFRLVKSLLSG